MGNIDIRFAKKDECERLAYLSKEFAAENCCNNIIADDEKYFLNKKVAIAIYKQQIVGYCYGSIKKEVGKKSYSEVGDLYYDLQEIFVLKEFRNKKIGRTLFEFVTAFAKSEGCKTMRLNAVSKNYKQILKFYIDNLGMDFISAYLIKKLN